VPPYVNLDFGHYITTTMQKSLDNIT